MFKISKIINYALFSLVFIIHILIALLFFVSYKYINLNPSIFYSGFGILIILILIIDIIFFLGLNFKDSLLKHIALSLSILFVVFSSFSIYAVGRINSSIKKSVNSSGSQTEKMIVNFVAYDNPNLTTLSALNNKKIGVLHTNDDTSVVSIGKRKLELEKVNVTYKEYNTFMDMMLGLINKEIDAVITDNTYNSQLKNNEGFEGTISKLTLIHSFDESVATESGGNDKDIVSKPFTVLLIGYAQEEGGGGLADSIILASVNPTNLTVTFTSIARDSYVPISCYSGKAKDKITHSRAISRGCLIDSVSDLLDVDIDFYAEINFKGVVDVVDALGGITIDSPIEFVGQNSSLERGNMTVWIGKGHQLANGEQALAFARERKQMPNGDFDRQNHQQQVIKEIVRKLMSVKDVNTILNVIDIAGENFKTNLSIEQIVSMFNYLTSIKVYTGANPFDSITFNNMRVMGYSSWSYNYGAQMALWVYPLYEGSIKENIGVIKETLDQYSEIKQNPRFKFSYEYTFEFKKVPTEIFNESIVHEEMPDVIPVLTDMTLSEAQSWASSKGVSLVITYLSQGDPGWFENGDGTIVSQDENTRPGMLLSSVGSIRITAIGQDNPENYVPNFVNGDISVVNNWVNANGYSITYIEEEPSDSNMAGKVKAQSVAPKTLKTKQNSITITYYKVAVKKISAAALSELTSYNSVAEFESWVSRNLRTNLVKNEVTTQNESENNKIVYGFNADPVTENTTLTVTIYKYTAPTTNGNNNNQNSEGNSGETNQENTETNGNSEAENTETTTNTQSENTGAPSNP